MLVSDVVGEKLNAPNCRVQMFAQKNVGAGKHWDVQLDDSFKDVHEKETTIFNPEGPKIKSFGSSGCFCRETMSKGILGFFLGYLVSDITIDMLWSLCRL